jgi:myosin heavy subunit
MLIRICLVVAIIAGLAVGGLNFVKVKEKITTLQANLKEQTEGRQKAESELAATKSDLEKTTTKLKQTETTLAATTEEKDKAVAEAAAQVKRADKLNDDLKRTIGERDTARDELERYVITGLKPEQIIAANKMIKSLQAATNENEVVIKARGQEIKRLKNELARFVTPDYHGPPLPNSCAGKVLASDPKWKFVIVDIGENQGMLQYAELLVNRDGKLVAKLKVTTVEKNSCVANVLPGWQLGDVVEGDLVIPAYPAS